MTNSKKSNQIPGPGKNIIDVEGMKVIKLLTTGSEQALHY